MQPAEQVHVFRIAGPDEAVADETRSHDSGDGWYESTKHFPSSPFAIDEQGAALSAYTDATAPADVDGSDFAITVSIPSLPFLARGPVEGKYRLALVSITKEHGGDEPSVPTLAAQVGLGHTPNPSCPCTMIGGWSGRHGNPSESG